MSLGVNSGVSPPTHNFQSFCQKVATSIFIPIESQSRTDMSSLGQRLLDNSMTRTAFRAGVLRRHGNDNFAEYLPIIFQPFKELSPSRITNTFGKAMVFNRVMHLQVFKHHQIARFNRAPCQFHGKVFTLARDFQVFSSQFVNRFFTLVRAFLFAINPTLKPFKSFLGFSQMAGIFNLITSIVSVEVHQADIKSSYLFCRFDLLKSIVLNTKLSLVAICFTHNSNSFYLLGLIVVKVKSPYHPKSSSFKPISERDRLPIFRKLVPTGFIFNRTSFLEFGITFFLDSWIFAVVIKPLNRLPSAFGRCLTGLRIKLFCPFVLFSQNCTEGRQVVLSDTAIIHPVSNTTVSDKASRAYHLVDDGKLSCRTSEFGFEYKHDQVINFMALFYHKVALRAFICWSPFISTPTYGTV